MSKESSLKQYDRLTDRVRQHRQGSQSPILIVEGPDDKKVLKQVLPGFEIFPAPSGRKSAISESVELNRSGFARWACVVDVDFDLEPSGHELGSRLYPYEGADLEAMLIEIGVLHTLIEHLGSDDKVSACGGLDTVVERLCASVEGVANLRQKNAQNNWGLPFDSVALETKIDDRKLQLKVLAYCTALSRGVSKVKMGTLMQEAERSPSGSCRYSGKDVMAAVAVGLRHLIGSLTSAQVNVEVLTASLRSSSSDLLRHSQWRDGLIVLCQK